MKKTKNDIWWHIPKRKSPIAYSTRAANDLIVALAEDGGTIKEIYARINYDEEARAILRKYIDCGFGDIVAKEWFKGTV